MEAAGTTSIIIRDNDYQGGGDKIKLATSLHHSLP